MTTPAQMLQEDDLGPADEALLDLLQEGRITAAYAGEDTGYNTQYVRDRLGRLVEHGHVAKLYQGLYELVEDPRDTRSEVPAAPDLSFTPLGKKNISYGPSSHDDAAFVLRVGTDDGTVEIHLDKDEMYELWTEVQHTPWPDTLDEQEEAGDLRQRLVDLAMGANAEHLRDALDALDSHWRDV